MSLPLALMLAVVCSALAYVVACVRFAAVNLKWTELVAKSFNIAPDPDWTVRKKHAFMVVGLAKLAQDTEVQSKGREVAQGIIREVTHGRQHH